MTISQPSSSAGSSCAEVRAQPVWAGSFVRFVYLALVRWRERKRAKADLARLAEAGDYLLRDVGLDPTMARHDPAVVLDQITRIRD